MRCPDRDILDVGFLYPVFRTKDSLRTGVLILTGFSGSKECQRVVVHRMKYLFSFPTGFSGPHNCRGGH